MQRSTMMTRRARLNMRIPSELLGWAKVFASKKNTNLTQLFVDYLTDLREQGGPKNGLNGHKTTQSR
jgi:hypothetical protein